MKRGCLMKTSRYIFRTALLSLMLSLLPPGISHLPVQTIRTEAAVQTDNVTISQKKVTLIKGKSTTLKIKGTKQKVKWTSSKKSVATVSSKGKVTAKKKGTAVITAKVGNQKYTCKVTVQNPEPPAGSRQNPLYAYCKYTSRIYRQNQSLGRFMIQLLDYKDGKTAKDYILKNNNLGLNPVPQIGQRYVYVKFKITYLSGSSQVKASDVVNYSTFFYNADTKKKLRPVSWAFNCDDVTDMTNVLLTPGESFICSKAMLVRSDTFPATYCLQTGYDKVKQKPVYTWFTTKK